MIFLESLRDMARLHELTIQGKGVSDESERIGNDLEFRWYKLTDRERDLLGEVSETLMKEYERETGEPFHGS